MEQRIRDLEEEGQKKDANLTLVEERSKVFEDRLQQASLQNDVIKAQVGEQVETHRLAAEQLEVRMRQMELESVGNLTILQRRSKELENQLQQATVENEKITAHFNDEAQAHQEKVAQLEQRMRDMEAKSTANVAALQHRSKELEDQLQAASLENEKTTVQANEQARSHRTFVEQLEERIRQIEAEGNAYISALEHRSKELEDHLHQASVQNDQLRTRASEQAESHQHSVDQFEQRIREMDAEKAASQAALQQHSRDLEEQLQKAAIRQERVTTQASEQVQAYRVTVEKLEQRLREMDAAGTAKVAVLQQRAKDLEEKLLQAALLHERTTARADEQERAHRATVDKLEQRMRDVEGNSTAKMAALQQHARQLEDELQQATMRHERIAAQAGEQEQSHRETVEQLEQRVRAMEAERGADAAALQQRATELEDQLQQANARHENEMSIAHQESAGRIADIEQLTLQIRGLEAERDTKEGHLQALQAHVKELEEQLQQSAGRTTVEKAKVAVNSSEQFLRRAEWITACTVGPILPHGLIAAETYASAALAANPQSTEASQLLAELARIHRAHPEGLPSATEAVTAFDEKAAAFFAEDLARAADLAEDEANRRARAGMNRSALLTASVALELRQKSEPAGQSGDDAVAGIEGLSAGARRRRCQDLECRPGVGDFVIDKQVLDRNLSNPAERIEASHALR